MKILGFDATNPFSLFLILILLLAANGSFDPKTVSSEAGDSPKKQGLWQDWTAKPLFQRRGGPRILLGRSPIGKRIRLRRELAVSLPKVMPLGR
ncbi:MAG TPA: hypothetical protein GX512_02015 [Firmicutes bacterium]|nr:hypothetical protein [Candidatus Fermentithermobacillaceae bacterium]